jgi:Bacterial Ig-like domain (group 2)
MALNSTLANAEIYDPVSKSFSYGGTLAQARTFHTATLLTNGQVLIAGGSWYDYNLGYSNPVTSAELYDPLTNAFTPIGTSWSTGSISILLNTGQVFFYEPFAQLYDIATKAFTNTDPGIFPNRGGAPATLLGDGTVLVAGGANSSTPLASSETYDPVGAAFSSVNDLATARYSHSATRLPSGKVLIAGGFSSGGTSLSTTETYDPVAKVFAPGPSMATPRAMHLAVPLYNGTVLLIGGDSSTPPTAEVFDPATQTFVGAGSLFNQTGPSTATLLKDGTVLVTDGDSAGSVELYGGSVTVPQSLQITPVVTSLLTGDKKRFVVVDELGQQRYDVTWTISDSNVATIDASGTPMLTAVTPGQATLSANVQGVVAQVQITVVPNSVQVTPATASISVGDTKQFNAVDELGRPMAVATWTISDDSLASITTESSPTLTAMEPGTLTVTANVEGVTSQAQVTIYALGTMPTGTTTWSVPSVPGFAPTQIAQAVPTDSGPDLYSIQASNDGRRSVVQALTADGRQMWQQTLPILNGNSVPDGSGGLIVTENNTCFPGQTDPMTIVDLDSATGQQKWGIAAAGVQNGSQTLYCYPDQVKNINEPQIAVRGDGTVFIAAMINNGLPPLTMKSDGGSNGGWQQINIPSSTFTQPDGTVVSDFSPEGPPMVDVDGSTYMEYEVRQLAYPPKITSAVLYLLKVAPDNTPSTVTLSSTTDDTNLLPGRIIPDGQGGLLATWIVSPSNGLTPGSNPYQAARIVSGSPGTPYGLRFTPHTAAAGSFPDLVLGENGTAFAKGITAATDGSNNDVDEIVSFDLNSGTPNWSYDGSNLSIVAATAGGGLIAKTTDASGNDTVIHFDSSGSLGEGSTVSAMADSIAIKTADSGNVVNASSDSSNGIQASWTGDLFGFQSTSTAKLSASTFDWAVSAWVTTGGNPSSTSAAVEMSWYPELDHCTAGGGCIGHYEAIYNALDDLIRRLKDPGIVQSVKCDSQRYPNGCTASDLAQINIFDHLGSDKNGNKLYTTQRFLSYLGGNRPRFYGGLDSTYCYSSLTTNAHCYKEWYSRWLNSDLVKDKFADIRTDAVTGAPSNPFLSFFRPTSIGYTSLGENLGNEGTIFHEALHGMTGLQDWQILDDLGMNSLTHPSCSISLRIQNSVLKDLPGLDQTNTWTCPDRQGDE